VDNLKSNKNNDNVNIETMTQDDIRYLIQNLQTYQIELELKNEELRNIRSELTKEKLKKDEAFFKELTENSSDIIVVVNKTGTITYVSPSVERFLGYRPEELIGKSGFKYIHPADIPRALLDFGKSVLMKETAIPNSFRVLHKDSSVCTLEGFGKNLLQHPIIAGFVMNIHDISERKQAENSLLASKKVLQKLRERFQTVVDDERTRIAREIHDDIGQSLTGLSMDLALLQRELDKPESEIRGSFIHARLGEMNTTVNSLVGRVREIATELRLEVLDDLGLSAAIRWKIREFKERTAQNYRFKSTPRDISLEPKINSFLFRIFTEAMTNIVRHAEAQNVEITIEQKTQSLLFQIADDGKGINKHLLDSSKSLGIYSMREYAETIGARLNISSHLRKGTSITVELPLEKPKHD